MIQYYRSHIQLAFIQREGQEKFLNAEILVIGAGGLGCPCLIYLAGCGIGTISIADFDIVSESNLKRQVLFSAHDIGLKKTSVVVKQFQERNPYIRINEHDLAVDEKNILSLIKPYDIVVDATDNFLTRYLINDACVVLDKPLVYGAIFQTEGHVTVFNKQQSATLRDLFPEPGAADQVPNCSETGAYNIITGLIGTMMANEVVKLILEKEESCAERLICLDSLFYTLHEIKYQSLKGETESLAWNGFRIRFLCKFLQHNLRNTQLGGFLSN